MGTVTGLTAARMLEIEAACIVAGAVSLGPGPTTDHLILTKHDGSTVDAGNVRGPAGANGTNGTNGTNGAKGTGFYTVVADLANISGVAGSAIGDYFVNGDTVNHTILGVANVTPGSVIRATTATAGVAAGSIRGAAGTPGAVTKIGDFSLVSGGTILRYSAIPQTYKHLRVLFAMQSSRAGLANTGARCTINAINTFYETAFYGYTNAPAVSNGFVASTSTGYLGQCPAGTRGSDAYVMQGTIDIPFYSDANNIKQMFAETYSQDGVSYSAKLTLGINNYSGVAAIDTFSLLDDVGSVLGPRAKATLYGIS